MVSRQLSALEFVISDGSGLAVSTGLKGWLQCPGNAVIAEWTLLADQSGSMVVDVFRCTVSQFDGGVTHPVAGDSITGGSPPSLVSEAKANASFLSGSGWTTSLRYGDVIAFNVNSTSGVITKATIALLIDEQMVGS